jgi:hypothetical protein
MVITDQIVQELCLEISSDDAERQRHWDAQGYILYRLYITYVTH